MPEWARVRLVSTRLALVAERSGIPSFTQSSWMGGAPVTLRLNVWVVPLAGLAGWGCVRIRGGKFSPRSAGELSVNPTELEAWR